MEDLLKIKANSDIFLNTRVLNIGNKLELSLIKHDLLEAEAGCYFINSRSEELRSQIPGAHVKSEEEAKNKLLNYTMEMGSFVSIFYSIRIKPHGIPVGYVLLNTPRSMNGLGEWSMDFWIHENYRRRKYVYASIITILDYLQEMNVKLVFAMVEENNKKCINLLEKVGFGFLHEHINQNRNILLYGIKLQ